MKQPDKKNPKSEAYTKYIELLQQGGSMPYLDEEDWEDIVYDFNDDRNIESAHYALAEALRQHPDSIILRKIHIMLLIEEKRIAEATEELQPYLNDGSYETLRLLFALQIGQGKADAALQKLIDHLQRGDIMPLEFTDMVNDYWNEIDDNELIQKYALSALEIIQDDAEAFIELGIILADTDDFVHAALSQEKALDIDAYSMKAWHNAVRCYFEMGEFDRCLECCDLALAIDDYSPILHFARSYCYMQSELWQEAVSDLVMVRAHIIEMKENGSLLDEYATIDDANNQMISTLDSLGQCYQNLNRIPEAIEVYEKLLELIPRNQQVFFTLTCLYLDQGEHEKGLNCIEAAIRLSPRNQSYRTMRVTLLTACHRYDEALEELARLIHLSPKNTSYRVAKAELAWNIGYKEDADFSYRQLLKLHPKDELSRKSLRNYFTSIGDDEALKEI